MSDPGIRISSFIAGPAGCATGPWSRSPEMLSGNAETESDTPVIAVDVPQEREGCVERASEFLAEHAVANEPRQQPRW